MGLPPFLDVENFDKSATSFRQTLLKVGASLENKIMPLMKTYIYLAYTNRPDYTLSIMIDTKS